MKLIGKCGVNAGLLMVGDPRYFIGEGSETRDVEWDGFCDSLHISPQLRFRAGHTGLGVAISTAYGDGEYPVYEVGEGNMCVITGDYNKAADELRKLADQLEEIERQNDQ